MSTQAPVAAKGAEDDEDDYMNMVIVEPTQPKQKETYTQRRLRKERESEARGRAKSKAELAEEEKAAREDALSKSMLTDPAATKNKGLAMMAKMGFKPGVALGSKNNIGARTEPIGITMKEDRGGIGLDTEKKRKFRTEVEREGKRVKAEEVDYRERVGRELEEVRLGALVGTAMRVAERMHGEREEEEVLKANAEVEAKSTAATTKGRIPSKPLKQINVLWRGLIKRREEKERDGRMRHDLQQSLSRLPAYDDSDEDKDDKRALGKDTIQHTLVEDLDEEDPELEMFEALDPGDRLQKLVEYLREAFNYCFWCKYTYPDTDMEGCPGLTEEKHN